MLILSKRSKSKAIHSLILTIRLLAKGNIVEIIKISGCQGFQGRKEGRNELMEQRIYLYSTDTILYNPVTVET